MATVEREVEFRNWLIERVAQIAFCRPEDVDVEAAFAELGLSSRDAVVLSGEIAERLNRPIEPTILWTHPTVARLTRHLTGGRP